MSENENPYVVRRPVNIAELRKALFSRYYPDERADFDATDQVRDLLDVADAARELAVRLHDNPDAPQAAYDELLRTLDRFEWERA